jgi:hypothetical protein
MANTIILKHSTTSGLVPNSGSLQVGELAVNTADGKLFTKHSNNSVIELGGGGSNINSVVIEVDFGTNDSIVETYVSGTWVNSNSIITVSPSCQPTVDHDPEDYILEGIFGCVSNIVPGSGFNILAGCKNSTFGKYKLNIIGV